MKRRILSAVALILLASTLSACVVVPAYWGGGYGYGYRGYSHHHGPGGR